MSPVRTVLCHRRLFGPLCVAAAVLGMGAAAHGEEHHYVLRDGQKFVLEKSASEVAVSFRREARIEDARKRLEAAGHGRIVDFPEAPLARVKLMRVPAGKTLRRAGIRRDAAVVDVQPVFRFAGLDSPVAATGTIVLELVAALTDGERDALWADYGIISVEPFRGLTDVYLVKPSTDVDEVLLAERMAEDDRTQWANPDFRRTYRRTQVGATDPLMPLQWHLENTGQAGGVVDADIDASGAWSLADGQGVRFGALDDSFDVDHEDLLGNYIGTGHDVSRLFFEPDYNDPRPKSPLDDHGTAVIGLAVAGFNSVGVRGVAFGAEFTASRGLFEAPRDSDVASAYTFALEQNVDVHINSWGPVVPFPVPPVLESTILTAVTQGRDLDGPGGQDPLGMVVLFASGNENRENVEGLTPSAIPGVISIGASTGNDLRADFSNFGQSLSMLAPGGSGINIGITTTDVEDGTPQAPRITQGYNIGGDYLGFPGLTDIEPTGSYTGFFGGTSAACPIAAGVAGLMLSANPNLTATQVRIIMEHTADPVSPDDAQYDGVSQRSFKYGYGRVNAERAVQAAVDAEAAGGLTWPDVPTNARALGSDFSWNAGSGTEEFLVLESLSTFTFTPLQGECYSKNQSGCAAAVIAALPAGVSVLDVVTCDGSCVPNSEHSLEFTPADVGTKLLAVWGRNAIGQYSFGASAETSSVAPPSVTIVASPLVGSSPLTVTFNGNAVSPIGIDPTRTVWDFDISDSTTINQSTPTATYVYEAGPGEIRIFTARLTMTDIVGNTGSAQVQIRVIGATSGEGPTDSGGPPIRIVFGNPETPGSDVPAGVAPFAVELRVESDETANVESVIWDVGDGSPQVGGLAVPHTYVNETSSELVLPVTATVRTRTQTGTLRSSSTTRLITVFPGAPAPDIGEPNLPGTTPGGSGGSAPMCGVLGIIPLLFTLTGLMLLRRRRA